MTKKLQGKHGYNVMIPKIENLKSQKKKKVR